MGKERSVAEIINSATLLNDDYSKHELLGAILKMRRILLLLAADLSTLSLEESLPQWLKKRARGHWLRIIEILPASMVGPQPVLTTKSITKDTPRPGQVYSANGDPFIVWSVTRHPTDENVIVKGTVIKPRKKPRKRILKKGIPDHYVLLP